MLQSRIAFVAHFVICLALAATAFFAWHKGVIQWVWANDQTMVTSVVVCMLAYGTIRIGWLAWNVGHDTDATDGHWIVRLCIYTAYTGTAIGMLLLARHHETTGNLSFEDMAAALSSTATGGVAAIFLEIMTRSLEHGIARAKR